MSDNQKWSFSGRMERLAEALGKTPNKLGEELGLPGTSIYNYTNKGKEPKVGLIGNTSFDINQVM